MIPLASITDWSNSSPWGNLHFVEQDLLLSRMLVDLYNDDMLSEKLAFRGGTAIHKLFMHPQPRYSEDIDLVQLNPEPIGMVLNRIREIFTYLGKPSIKQTRRSNNVFYRFETETLPQAKLRIKIEINCQEHLTLPSLVMMPFEVKNSWFSGKCEIKTYSIDELIGTKLRALYQRKKGRDLFDIDYALKNGNLDIEKTIFYYQKYMELSVGQVPSAKLYFENLSGKVNDPLFISDIIPLLRPGIQYDNKEALESFRKHFVDAM
jgi:predicted nucleotidyltransferase component of viral defense system